MPRICIVDPVADPVLIPASVRIDTTLWKWWPGGPQGGGGWKGGEREREREDRGRKRWQRKPRTTLLHKVNRQELNQEGEAEEVKEEEEEEED